jgi:hypothetical protein
MWVDRGREILESELVEQVFADGMHFERATGYHKYTAEFYVHFLMLTDAFGVSVSSGARAKIRAQVAAAATLRRPDGTWPVIGDEDSGDTLLLTATATQDQGPLLALGGALFRDAGLVSLTSHAQRAAGWWMLDDAAWRYLAESTLRTPTNTTASSDVASGALPDAGYFMGRDDSASDDWWCLVDAGPHGGNRTGHAHTDLGHVEIAHGSAHLVVDPGCAGYTIDLAARDTARSEAVHACLVTAGEALALPAGPFSWSRLAPTPVTRYHDDGRLWWCELAYDRGDDSARLTHRRQVVLVRGHGVVVCDWVTALSPIAFAIHWPLGEALDAADVSDASLTARDHGITWSAASGSAGVVASVDAMRRSPGYGRECAGQLLRLSHPATSRASVVTCFADARRPLRVRAHDESVIRVVVADDASDTTYELVIAPEAAPRLDASPAPSTSSRVLR